MTFFHAVMTTIIMIPLLDLLGVCSALFALRAFPEQLLASLSFPFQCFISLACFLFLKSSLSLQNSFGLHSLRPTNLRCDEHILNVLSSFDDFRGHCLFQWLPHSFVLSSCASSQMYDSIPFSCRDISVFKFTASVQNHMLAQYL